MRHAVRTLLVGALLGLALLGVGSRLAMAAIAIDSGQPSSWSFGGSMTVILLGGVSGLAGAAIALVSQMATRRLSPRWTWIHYPLVAITLGAITTRGLRGTDPSSHWYFYVLVGLYGVAVLVLTRGRPASQSHLPGRFASE